MQYHQKLDAFTHEDYPDLVFEPLSIPPCDRGYQHMVEDSVIELPDDVDNVFEEAARQIGDDYENSDETGIQAYEEQFEFMQRDNQVDTLDYDRFFLQFGLTAGDSFGVPFVQVYGAKT